MRSGTREVLLIEDNLTDAEIVVDALQTTGPETHVTVVTQGDRALEHLRALQSGERRRPDLVLLDLRLGDTSGHDLLTFIKTDASLTSIPVVVLTNSRDEADVERAYRQHANSYITKPVELDHFVDVLRSLSAFWLDTAELPGR
jgi:CheY-like chemotaxis protein